MSPLTALRWLLALCVAAFALLLAGGLVLVIYDHIFGLGDRADDGVNHVIAFSVATAAALWAGSATLPSTQRNAFISILGGGFGLLIIGSGLLDLLAGVHWHATDTEVVGGTLVGLAIALICLWRPSASADDVRVVTGQHRDADLTLRALAWRWALAVFTGLIAFFLISGVTIAIADAVFHTSLHHHSVQEIENAVWFGMFAALWAGAATLPNGHRKLFIVAFGGFWAFIVALTAVGQVVSGSLSLSTVTIAGGMVMSFIWIKQFLWNTVDAVALAPEDDGSQSPASSPPLSPSNRPVSQSAMGRASFGRRG